MNTCKKEDKKKKGKVLLVFNYNKEFKNVFQILSSIFVYCLLTFCLAQACQSAP